MSDVGRGAVAAALWASVGCACGARFVEPNPPALVTAQRVLTSGQYTEPVVFGAVLDLHVADPATCAAVQDRALAELRSVAWSSGEQVRELATQDLAPGCVRLPDRTVSLAPLDAELRAAEADFPGRTVRAVVLYVNNIDLPVPADASAALLAFRSGPVGRGLPAAIVLGLVCPRAAASWPFDATIGWTHSADEAMWSALRARLAADLPLVSRAGPVQAPLLDPTLRAVTLELKVCGVTGSAVLTGCPRDGSACELRPGDDPTVYAWFSPLVAVPRSAASAQQVVVRFEACTLRCDRFVDSDGSLARWDAFRGCVGGGA